MEFVNKTNHHIKIYDDDYNLVTDFPPADKAARVRRYRTGESNINGVPVMTEVIKQVENLPEPQEEVMYIVSGFVRHTLHHRDDLVSPDVSERSIIKDITEDDDIDGIKRLTK